MFALLGEQLPVGMPDDWTMSDRIRHGREYLIELAKVDVGYDPLKWHEHLRATNAGGYRWSNKHLQFPKQIAQVMADPQWIEAVEALSRNATAGPTTDVPPL